MTSTEMARSLSPSPSPGFFPGVSLPPGSCRSQNQLTPHDGALLIQNASLSPSAESLRTTSMLQIPPPPPSRPRSASSLLSLPQQPDRPRPRQSSVCIPHLPPPPRPRSSPSLSSLLTVQNSSSTPQLSTRLASSSKLQKQQEKELLEQQEILRKYSTHLTSASTLRVDSHLKGKSTEFITSLVSGDRGDERSRNFLDDDDRNFRSLEDDVECPRDTARVRFLPKDRGAEERLLSLLSPLTRRERVLGVVIVVLMVMCAVFLVVVFSGDSRYRQLGELNSENPCVSSTCVSTAAQLMSAMDRGADPCHDFFRFACGGWNQRHVIPADQHSYTTFEKLHDELQLVLRQLLEQQITEHDSEATLKAKTLYTSCVNTTQINHIGDEPLRRITDDLGGWPVLMDNWDSGSFSLETVLAKIRHDFNAVILVGCWVGADDKNSSSNIIQLDQPELGMPDREYYLKGQTESEFVQAYLNFMKGVIRLMGAPEDDLDHHLLDILEFETMLANITRPRAESLDTEALYRKMSIASLQKLVPQMDWLQYLRGAVSPTLTSEEEVVVFAVDYLRNMMSIVQQTEKRVVANYVIWRVVMQLSPELTDSYQEVYSHYNMVLHGVKRAKIRWKKCVKYVNDQMGLAVGALFVRDHFRRKSKETAMEMIQTIQGAFNELLTENAWMDDRTKFVARQKASSMNARIGYPDFITDPRQLDRKYEGLLLDEAHYFANILALRQFASKKKAALLGKPVEKDAWEQPPAEINAFYNPNSNDIVFPAGILQPLFYSEHFPKSLNYGGIGVVIGHEITHGFDDRGRQYDVNGNLVQWWDNATIEAFRKRTQCMVRQYSSFKLEQTGHYINGKHTQGENIADNGGLKQAYRAYRKWVEVHGEERPLPGIGLTHDQLFFLNYAQIWCGNMRDEEALHTIRTSAHSPAPVRVLGPLSNSLDFARAYNCPVGSRMNPRHKCSVW